MTRITEQDENLIRQSPRGPTRDELFRRVAQQAQAEVLLSVLNRSEGESWLGYHFTPASREKITDIVSMVKRTIAGLELLPPVTTHGAYREARKRFEADVEAINGLLNQVRLVPFVDISSDARSLSTSERVHIERGSRMSDIPRKNVTGTELNTLEQTALLGLTDLLKRGEVDALRRCECGDWFLAVRSDQKSCSATCRQRRHATTEAFRKTRKTYRARKAEMEKVRVSRAKTVS